MAEIESTQRTASCPLETGGPDHFAPGRFDRRDAT
jgi:hypothetical protein